MILVSHVPIFLPTLPTKAQLYSCLNGRDLVIRMKPHPIRSAAFIFHAWYICNKYRLRSFDGHVPIQCKYREVCRVSRAQVTTSSERNIWF